MMVQCPKCLSKQNIFQSGVFNCGNCNARLNVSQEAFVKSQLIAPRSKVSGGCILLLLLFFLMIAAAGFLTWQNWQTLFPDTALKYVPADCEWVIYGNTKTLQDSKLWRILVDSSVITEKTPKAFAPDLKLEDLEGNIALWGHGGSAKNGKISATVVLNNSSAVEKFYEKIKRTRGITEGNIDGYPALIHQNYVYIKINNRTIQFHSFKAANAVKPQNANAIARRIHPQAVLALGCSNTAWKSMAADASVVPADKFLAHCANAGDLIVEVFLNDHQIQVRGNIDISKIK